MDEPARRTFLHSAIAIGLGGASTAAGSLASSIPIVDTHVHLFDQTRPQGAPYSAAPRNTTPALPARYRKLAAPQGIVSAIVVEASPWIEDNLWALQVAESDPIITGVIGNLQPEKPEFREYLDRHRKNKLFLGIRYGNLWGYNLVQQLSSPVFMEGLKLLQDAGLTLDTANPRPDLLEAVLRLSDRLPGLRIVVDHLPALLWRLDARERSGLEATLRELARRPSVYIKVSAVMRMVDGKASTSPALYKPLLDQVFESFHEDRLVFGSDWPNADAVDNLPAIVQIARDYMRTRGPAAAEKLLWRNSIAAYRWVHRDPTQPK